MPADLAIQWTLRLFGLACIVLGAERLYCIASSSLWIKCNAALAVQRGQFSSAVEYSKAKAWLQLIKVSSGIFFVFATALNFWLTTVFAFILVITLILDRQTEHVGGDGADQQLRVISLVILFTSFTAHFDQRTLELMLVFLAIQLLVTYTFSGFAKILRPEWRNGEVIRGLMVSSAFGNKAIYSLFNKHNSFIIIAAWSTIIFELAFSLISFLHHSIAIWLALLFHVLTSVIMRINSFLWVFSISFPSILYIYNYAE